MTHLKRTLLVLPFVLAAHQGTAHAQSATQEISLERFRLSLDEKGILDVESGEVSGHMDWKISAWLGYEDDPLVLRDRASGDRIGALVSDRIAGGLVLALGLWDRFQIGLDIPFVGSQNAEELDQVMQADLSASGIGDVRLVPKVMIFGGGLGTSLSFMPSFTAPTAGANDYRGTDNWSFQPELALSQRGERYRFGVNLSYVTAHKETLADLKVDDQINLRLGAAIKVTKAVELGLTYHAATLGKDPFEEGQDTVMEIVGGPTFYLSDSFIAFAAAGVGIANGYGTPDWRGLFGIRFCGINEEEAPRLDSDGDGLYDDEDECPQEPETLNDYKDSDGCPDETPQPADLDSDGDGMNDDVDGCPERAEDVDGFEDEDGCPDPDNDKDGVLDVDDKCPMVVGVKEQEGCPEPDRDGDTVIDRLDNCPDEPGEVANQGCKKKQLVKLGKSGLEILDVVYFKTNKAKIRIKSNQLLNNVAEVLKSHPEIEMIRVEGHTDDRGSDASNLSLSQRRAEAVVAYLVRKGVKKERLVAKGFGEAKPIADNETNEGRTTNRRVEFVIVGGENVQTNRTGPDDGALD